MPAPTSTDDLLALIRGSGLLDGARLEAFLAGQSDDFDAPRTLAVALIKAGLLTQYQAERLLEGRSRGFVIGDYTILDRLGAGGGGLVFLGEHRTAGCRVAIKILTPDAGQDAKALARFRREGRAVAYLDHPNIVRAYDIGSSGTIHYLVMEFVDGSNFQDLVDQSGPLSPGQAAHYARQAAEALQHLHQAGLVHRDIKPSNLLLDRSGVVKLLDLGLARFCQDLGDRLTSLQGAGVMGSADYLSPEQALDSHSVDIRTDIYGLGATLYFLLVGRPLFPGATVAQKLLWVQLREPEDVRQLRPEIPEGLAVVVRRMMAKRPKDRYQTPQEVVDALAACEEEQPHSVEAGPAETASPAGKNSREAGARAGARSLEEQRPGGTRQEKGRPAPTSRGATPGSGKRWWPLGVALLGLLTVVAGLGWWLWHK
jgi:serine/threonine protein kinase